MRESTDPPASIVPPGRYRHFKGNIYEVLLTARHSETDEELVVYRPEGSPEWWARPLSMFAEVVMHGGREVQRFERIAED